MKFEKELEIAKKAAFLSGNSIRNLTENLDVKFKETKDIVTKADLQSQILITNTIKEQFPDDKFLTEESDLHELSQNRTWIIDPLDGTVNFSRNIPIYGISIALFIEKKAILGLIYLPVHGEFYYAIKGEGCYCNRKRIYVSDTKDLSKSILNINDFNIGSSKEINNLNSQKINLITNLTENCMRLKNFSSAVLEFAYVASGKIDAYFMIYCGFWDIAAGLLLVEEAGGKTSSFDGGEINFESKYIIASNGILHNELLKLL